MSEGKVLARAAATQGHVLLAEDNPVSQRVAQRHLEGLGYSVDVVADGQEAITAFRRGRYDLVLMDCEMPNVDGFEAARRIRQAPGGHLPILALTANVSEGNHRACLAAGMNEVLLKPIAREILGAALHTWRQRARQGLVAPPR